MLMTPDTLLTAAVTILSILFVFYTGLVVAQMRGKHGVTAPAVTGHPEFERAYRVQVNTLEQFVMFLPLLWLATIYFKLLPWLPALLGLVWIIGRFLYMRGYLAAAEKRSNGFLITSLATLGLLILSVWGLITTWMAVNAV
jgi:glutathione S-transferase